MGWVRRYWKWLAPPILILFLVSALFFGVIRILKSSEPYQMAMEALLQDTRAVEVLGTPIGEGIGPRGSVNTSGNGSGSAELAISVSGPRGEGTVYLRASKGAGQWTMEVLVLQLDNQRINLLSEESVR